MIGLGYIHKEELYGYIESDKRFQINIPEEYWNTTKYRATLGHKLNHSFIKNKATFSWATHPRFGWIRSLYAVHNIYKGLQI